MSLTGKRALIMGGSQGTGSAIAKRLAADAGNEASQRAGFKVAATALGGIDILVRNAGITAVAAIEDDVDETFDRLFAVKVRGVQVGTRAAFPYMPDGGRIILIGSMGAGTAPFSRSVDLQRHESGPERLRPRLGKGPRPAQYPRQHHSTRTD